MIRRKRASTCRHAHRRVMSIAAVQQHLHSSARADAVEIAPYLSKLCNSLAESMIGESRPATIEVSGPTEWEPYYRLTP